MEQRRNNPGAPIAGTVMVVLGVLFLLQTTGVIGWGMWVHLIRFWPVLLIVIGLNIWLGPRRPWIAAGLIGATFVGLIATGIVIDANEPSGIGDGTLRVESIFGSAERDLSGQPFDGGEGSSIFGSVEIDLREAVHPGGAIGLELNAVFGSVEVPVPREWDVRIDGTPVLGSVDDLRTSTTPGEGAPVVNIDATAMFGSVTIRN